MGSIQRVFLLAGNNFKKWLINPRIYVLIILLVGYINVMVSPIKDFCIQFGYTVGPWIFPFLMAEPYSALMIMLGLILLFCDAPFIESEQPYIILRSGRSSWVVGQVIYIAITSAIYFITVAIITCLPLLSVLSFDENWGKVINTFAQTRIGPKHGIVIPFDYTLVSTFTPISAMLHQMLLAWLVGVIIGLLMFVLNLIINRCAGAIASAALAIFPLFIRQSDWGLHHFSPTSWLSLSIVDFNNATNFPSFSYVLPCLSILIILLVFCSVYSMRKRDIDILKSV